MVNSIIFTRHDKKDGLISWIGTNEWNTEEEAYDHAVRMVHEWWDENPTIVFTIYKHAMIWKTQKRDYKDED